MREGKNQTNIGQRQLFQTPHKHDKSPPIHRWGGSIARLLPELSSSASHINHKKEVKLTNTTFRTVTYKKQRPHPFIPFERTWPPYLVVWAFKGGKNHIFYLPIKKDVD